MLLVSLLQPPTVLRQGGHKGVIPIHHCWPQGVTLFVCYCCPRYGEEGLRPSSYGRGFEPDVSPDDLFRMFFGDSFSMNGDGTSGHTVSVCAVSVCAVSVCAVSVYTVSVCAVSVCTLPCHATPPVSVTEVCLAMPRLLSQSQRCALPCHASCLSHRGVSCHATPPVSVTEACLAMPRLLSLSTAFFYSNGPSSQYYVYRPSRHRHAHQGHHHIHRQQVSAIVLVYFCVPFYDTCAAPASTLLHVALGCLVASEANTLPGPTHATLDCLNGSVPYSFDLHVNWKLQSEC